MSRSALIARCLASAVILLSVAAVHGQDRNIPMHIVYPAGAMVDNGGLVIDVTRPPYNAKGDGVTDDTEAFVAVMEHIQDRNEKGQPAAFVYIPKGTYLVSDTIARRTRLAVGADYNYRLIGEDRRNTVIKLKDNLPAFGAGADKSVLNCNPSNKGNGGMMWGHMLRNLTIDTGKGNPGATGVTWRGANSTVIDNVAIRSGDGQGRVGLHLREWCVQGHFCDITIEGFDCGIKTEKPAETNPSIEYVTLRKQNRVGVQIERSAPCLRRIHSVNSVPAVCIDGKGSHCVLLDSVFEGGDAAGAAIILSHSDSEQLFVRNVSAAGYGTTIRMDGQPVVVGRVTEWLNGKVFSFDPSVPKRTLNLPIEEVTLVPWESDPQKWACPDDFEGADDLAKVQAAMNSGKPAIYFKRQLVIKDKEAAITIPASVRQIEFFGINHVLWCALVVKEASREPLWVEHTGDRPRFRIEAPRALHARSGTLKYEVITPEKVVLHAQAICRFADCNNPKFCPPNVTVYARSINEENWHDKPTPNFLVNGGTMWVLGFKTEAQNTAFCARKGSRLEVLGGYVNFAGKTQVQNPDVLDEDAEVSYIGTNFMGRTHREGIWKIRDGKSRKFLNDAFPRRETDMKGNYFVPLYVGRPDAQ